MEEMKFYCSRCGDELTDNIVPISESSVLLVRMGLNNPYDLFPSYRKNIDKNSILCTDCYAIIQDYLERI